MQPSCGSQTAIRPFAELIYLRSWPIIDIQISYFACKDGVDFRFSCLHVHKGQHLNLMTRERSAKYRRTGLPGKASCLTHHKQSKSKACTFDNNQQQQLSHLLCYNMPATGRATAAWL